MFFELRHGAIAPSATLEPVDVRWSLIPNVAKSKDWRPYFTLHYKMPFSISSK